MPVTHHYEDVPSAGTARLATDDSHYLSEGPVWDGIRERILWVDIMNGTVHSGRLRADGTIQADERYDFPDTAGAVAVAERGELVVAGRHRLYFRSADGVIRAGVELISGDERRFNDGKPDPRGRFVVGTLGPGGELLMRVDGDEVTVLDDDLTLSNGLAWSTDGGRFYSIDTWSKRIHVRDYDAATGATGRRELFARFEHGAPDGMTTDAEDHLWVAMWGEGCVLRISPAGRIVARIDVPAPHTSCVQFAGPELDTLVITTATEHLTAEQLRASPLSGRLFTARPGVRGNPPYLWNGRSSRAGA
ncbi:SMP-30/gluconolactonase/LRE family protein [Microbacterium sp.]|uniref:SMP-30/gluconolactonase/LRE family protein n=1 Tax=Microbacterium sp. TaxID=51671 RepID=UPI002C532E03|nr:SMP-30/gluconolactonase/LRE family protein [Microbacterium sp.]HWL76876.1 SMP-30/gluconolactonase/LRE family protein [Microbacterium sp.]